MGAEAPYMLEPSGLALANIVVAAISILSTSVLVVLRLYVRFTEAAFGWDDAGVGLGALAFAAQACMGIYGNLVGVSRVDTELNAWGQEQTVKSYILFLMIYVCVLVFLKTSICVTIYRIAIERRHRIRVWALLVFNWVSFLVLLLGVNLYCRPLSAMWDTQLIATGYGSCAPASVLVDIGEVATSVTVANDFALAILPALIIRKSTMSTKAKIQVFSLLSFASLASIVTIVRIPYMLRWLKESDLMVWGGFVELCALIEVCIGMSASCVPSVRRLFRRSHLLPGRSEPHRAEGDVGSLVTFGRLPVKIAGRLNLGDEQLGISLTTVQAQTRHEGDMAWDHLADGNSERGLIPESGIHTKRTYGVYTENIADK